MAMIHVLYEPHSGSSAEVDIVAVHGLGSSWEKGWTFKPKDDKQLLETNWLKDADMLPSEFPNARIMAFAYESQWHGSRTVVQRLAWIADQLLSTLEMVRKRCQTRPIIFVGHSFGGNVIEKAIVTANERSEHKDLFESTVGVLLLGTPLRGSKRQTLGSIVAKSAKALGYSDNGLIKALKYDSEHSKNLLESFTTLINENSIVAFCFFEQHMTGHLKLKALVVDKYSACIEGHPNRGLAANHRLINKYASPHDENYRHVLQEIEKMVRSAIENRGAKETIHSLDCAFPSHAFIGREDILQQIKETFETSESDNQKINTFVLYGMGGAGKTQIALKFSELYNDRFSNKFFLDASSEESLDTGFIRIGQRFGDIKRVDETLQWLSSQQPKWLMILDNADDPDFSLWRYLRLLKQGNIIITSRNPAHKVYGTSRDANAKIEGLPQKDAIGLLYKVARYKPCIEIQEKSGDELVKDLGYLPLAVVQAAGYIQHCSCSIEEYLMLLKTHRYKLLQNRSHLIHALEGYERTIYAAWDMSFEKLDKSAKDLLRLSALLFHKEIPKSMFRAAYEELIQSNVTEIDESTASIMKIFENRKDRKGTTKFPHMRKTKQKQQRHSKNFVFQMKLKTILESHWTTENQWDSFKFNNTIGQLISYSLIDWSPDRAGLYSLHTLVQAWVQDHLRASREDHYSIAASLVGSSIVWKFEISDHNYRRTLLAHVVSLHQGITDDVIFTFGDVFALVYSENGLFSKAEDLEAQVVEMSKKKLGEEHPNTLNSTTYLASTYQNLGRWKEAEDLQVLVFESMKRVLGQEHPNTLVIMNNLATTYQAQGRWKEAENLQLLVLETKKRMLGQQHPNTLTIMNNLATTYQNQGRWKEAEGLQLLVLETRKGVLGQEHPSTCCVMNNLATIYQNQGRWKEAEDLHVLVLETRKRVLGQEHPDTLTSMMNLASTYFSQDRWKEAEGLHVLALETRKRMFGQEHPNTVICMINLASTYQKQGRWKEAENLQLLALETKKGVLGQEHPTTLTIMNNLASTYENQGRWKEAEDLQVLVLETRKRVLGQEHPNTLNSMNNLALIYHHQDRWKEAEGLHVLVLETRKRVLGQQHPDTLDSMNSLAFTYQAQGLWKEAEDLQVLVLETRKRVLGQEHPDTLDSMNNLAFTYHHQGRMEEASEMMSQMMALMFAKLGSHHTSTRMADDI